MFTVWLRSFASIQTATTASPLELGESRVCSVLELFFQEINALFMRLELYQGVNNDQTFKKLLAIAGECHEFSVESERTGSRTGINST